MICNINYSPGFLCRTIDKTKKNKTNYQEVCLFCYFTSESTISQACLDGIIRK